ncbi:hypothetical protein M426DRAFT_94008 [Hypoxylon sp. CI-4A]|nr:hypothetical protein M426DRAFT_94008 [Hypoxylon sp. CI-4A]
MLMLHSSPFPGISDNSLPMNWLTRSRLDSPVHCLLLNGSQRCSDRMRRSGLPSGKGAVSLIGGKAKGKKRLLTATVVVVVLLVNVLIVDVIVVVAVAIVCSSVAVLWGT